MSDAVAGAADRRRSSITCWSTSTRTPTRCRPRSCGGSSPTGAASRSSATTRRRSTASARASVRNILASRAQFDPPAAVVTLEQNYRSTPPILEAANAVIALATERYDEAPASRRRAGGARPVLVTVADETGPGRVRRRAHPRAARSGRPAARAGGAVPRRAPQRRARGRARPAQHPVREVRRAQFPRSRARQGRALPACAGRRTRATRWRGSALAQLLPGHRAPAGRRAGRARGRGRASRSSPALASFVPPAAARERLAGARASCSHQLRGAGAAWAGAAGPRARAGTSRTWSGSTTTRAVAWAISSSWSSSPR